LAPFVKEKKLQYDTVDALGFAVVGIIVGMADGGSVIEMTLTGAGLGGNEGKGVGGAVGKFATDAPITCVYVCVRLCV